MGRKEQSTLTQRYAGYNATMQSLLFAPRAYYWEIRTTSPNLYILNRDPAHGRINANMKTYHLRRIEEFKEMLDDLCYLFLDELIYLRPLTYISSQCLRDKEYKDFLSKPPGLDAHIENQCWQPVLCRNTIARASMLFQRISSMELIMKIRKRSLLQKFVQITGHELKR